MKTENWQQVKEILEVAIEQSPNQREKFLAQKCSGDAALRSEIDSLISSYEHIGDFMEDGAISEVAESFVDERTELQPGYRLGHYEIVRVLGSGGMGKVYLADDLELHRRVAVKVLRSDLWWYKQARQRLVHEARAAARLDHPNICAIYEIEDTEENSFIVMQYIEGMTLGQILASGGLSARESLGIAAQIGEALEEAHAHHIIHRDVKPANVIINEKGLAKVLDFGLAKSIEPRPQKQAADLSSSGAVMGTVPYMSPEQLRGQAIDGRSDVFSFGTLLYEMFSGKQAFSRDSNAETIAAILNEEPDISIIPERFRALVRRSLMKNASDRYPTVTAMLDDIRALALRSGADHDGRKVYSRVSAARHTLSTAFQHYISNRIWPRTDSMPSNMWEDSDSDARTVRLTDRFQNGHENVPAGERFRTPALVASVLIVVLLIGLAVFYRTTVNTGDPHAFDNLRPVQLASWKGGAGTIYTDYRASHSGKMIAYSSTQDGPFEGIYIKQTAHGADIRVVEDEWRNHSPIWSPDDQFIAYASRRNGQFGIYKCGFLGGDQSLLASIGEGSLSLVQWSNDGSGIFYEFDGNLFRLDLQTKESHKLTDFESSRAARRYFALSPDEKEMVYTDGDNDQMDLWIRPVEGGEPDQLTIDGNEKSRPVWHPDRKRILYSVVRDGHSQINVAYRDGSAPEQITRGDSEYELIDISSDGTKLYYVSWADNSDVWSVDVATGTETQIAGAKEAEFWPAISPDGRSVVFQTNQSQYVLPFIFQSSLAMISLESGERRHLVQGYDPEFMPDGRRIAFLRFQGPEKQNALWILDPATGEERSVIDSGVVSPSFAALPFNRRRSRQYAFSPDGHEIAYLSRSSGIENVLKIADGADAWQSITANSDAAVKFYSPAFSRDGSKLAFTSETRSGDSKAASGVWVSEQGSTRQIFSTPEILRFLGWSADGALLCASTDGTIGAEPDAVRLIEISVDGKRRQLAQLESVYGMSMALSPDGKSIAFTVRDGDKDNIYIAAIGGAVRRITSNGGPRTFYGSLTWSGDGRQIIFDKQEQTSTISMFENFK